MRKPLKSLTLGLAAFVLAALFTTSAQAQIFYTPQVYAPPPVVSYSYYQDPGVSYYAAAYGAPVYSSYSSPVTVAAYPSTAVYSSAYAAYSPAYVAPGYVSTRSYVGLGVFRPRGVYTQSYYSPGTVVVPRRSYYPSFIYP